MLKYKIFDTDTIIGKLMLLSNEKSLLALEFTDDSEISEQLEEYSNKLDQDFIEEDTENNDTILNETMKQLSEYFKGERKEFTIPLDLSLSKGFRKRVQENLSKIPYGETVSYKELAIMSDSPKAFQAVGTSCGSNPISIILPCHRVTKAGGDGDGGNYGGGLDKKRFLLKLEKDNSF